MSALSRADEVRCDDRRAEGRRQDPETPRSSERRPTTSLTTAQGAEAGYSPQLLYKHVKAGRVRRVRRGIYRLVHFPMSDEEHQVECWLWAEHTGVFSHETALFYYDLSDVLPEHVYLTVPEVWRRRRFRVPEGLVLRYGHVPEAERTWLGPVPITKPARAIRDVIDTHLSPEHIERALAEAHNRGLIGGDEVDQLEARLRETRTGHPP